MNASRIALSALLLTSLASQTQAGFITRLPAVGVGSALAVSAFLLYQRDSKADFKPSYDIDKLKNVEWAKANKKEWLNQAWLFYYDAFVGQLHKSKKMVWDEESKSIVQKDACQAHGVLGKGAGYLKVTKEARKLFKDILFVRTAAGVLMGQNFKSFFNVLLAEDKTALRNA